MYTIKEIAEKYKVHDRTVMYWIKTKKLEALKVNRTVRITEEALNKFIELSNK